MARNHKPEEIIGKLREAEIVLAQGGTDGWSGRPQTLHGDFKSATFGTCK